MALIETSAKGEALNFANWALEALLDYVINNSSDFELHIQLKEAKEYGYLDLDALNKNHLAEFIFLAESYSALISTKDGIPPEYVVSLARRVVQMREWFPDISQYLE